MEDFCEPFQISDKKEKGHSFSEEARRELALLTLDALEKTFAANELPEEEDFLHEIRLIEEMGKDDLNLMCKMASQLFRYGVFSQKNHFNLAALDKLMEVEEKDPSFFDKNPDWILLWGNVFLSLSRNLKDLSFLQRAFGRFEKAETKLKENPTLLKELYWSWGEAWIYLGRHSQEISDFQKGIEKYFLASQLGYNLPHFRIDFGEALLALGNLKGDLESVEEALALFRGAIADTYFPKEEPTAAYLKSWVAYALAAKKRFELTHLPKHLLEADAIFREAVMNVLIKPELWLYWGELYLLSGWLNEDLNEVELALEKLTSSKIKECDPLRVSALLGQGLATLGYLLDDFSLIKEGQARVESALEVAPQNQKLLYSKGFIFLCEAKYLSDPVAYNKAVFIFEKNIEKNGADILSWQGLFQAYSGWGQLLEDPSLIQKAEAAISRLSSLRPFSCLYLNEWGILLLRKSELVKDLEGSVPLEEAIEKFKKAYKLSEDPEILYHLGCAYDLLGELSADAEDYGTSIEILMKVFEKNSSEPNVRYHLAKALSHYGELTLSLDHLEQASHLFYSLLDKNFENEELCLAELGYCLLNQLVLVEDPIHPEKAQILKIEAEKKLIRAIELGNKESSYHLACLYSLCHLVQNSMLFLEKARKWDVLPEIEDLEQDEWLLNVRATAEFKEFLMIHKQSNEKPW